MGYRNLRDCVRDLERTKQLVRIEAEIDADLEAAEIQRRVYRVGGPALYFANVKGCRFPMVSNLFGTIERSRFLFRDALEQVRKLVELKIDPGAFARRPWRYWDVPGVLWRLRPRMVRSGAILGGRTTLSQLPQLKSWPRDGGPFVTLPQVYTEHPDRRGWRHSNIGMYRVQLAGNDFLPDLECGLHYQIHRGIGVHHSAALARGEPLLVNVIVGGPPALAVAAVMPLPEDLPELAFAAALGGRRLSLVRAHAGGPTLPLTAEADFVIEGYVNPRETKPEGPFGDHLGYYSLTHDFPLMHVTNVYHRKDAIWPFTVVGRPPQEDTSFGELIHELTGPVIPTVIPGLHAVHAVDASGVHPLLLAIGSERYTPFAERRHPQELLTIANAILGQGQLSLAKFLFIAAKEDAPGLDIHDIPSFFRHILERVDWSNDLHFQTRTTMDTLDYSAGMGLNAGSKVVIAAVGAKRRELATRLPTNANLPEGFSDPRFVMPGAVAIRAHGDRDIASLCDHLGHWETAVGALPLFVVVDDAEFVGRSLSNFLWAAFTRSDPARDIHGVGAFTDRKHWGCTGSLVLDARLKPHMPPPLEADATVSRRVDDLASRGGPLHGII